jgi:uncharacterized protein YggU (UPF0235/DUF167 family)
MAKLRSQLPEDAIRALIGGDGRLAVRVTPNARADAVVIEPGTGHREAGRPALHIRVTAAPENGKANDAVIALIARAINTRKSALSVTQGHSARIKILRIADER